MGEGSLGWGRVVSASEEGFNLLLSAASFSHNPGRPSGISPVCVRFSDGQGSCLAQAHVSCPLPPLGSPHLSASPPS